MGIDEIYTEVIESARDIKHIREDIKDVKTELKEETKACNKRLSTIEAVQNLNVGKLSVILITIGAVVLGGVQILIWFLGKFAK